MKVRKGTKEYKSVLELFGKSQLIIWDGYRWESCQMDLITSDPKSWRLIKAESEYVFVEEYGSEIKIAT